MTAQHSRVPFDACPVCEAQEAQVVGTADCSRHHLYKPALPREMRWIGCTSCGHVFTDGYFDEAAMELIFSGANLGQLPGDDLAKLVSSREVSAQIVERVSRLRGEATEGRWLDVGFGNGALLTTAAEFGYDVVGLDLRREAVKRLCEAGFEAHAALLTDYAPETRFDVISLADVLEHMPAPKAALDHARGLLQDDGLLFVSMPNKDCFLWQALDRAGKNPYWGELEHFHNFGRRSLYALLARAGFTPVSYGVSLRYTACMEVVARPR